MQSIQNIYLEKFRANIIKFHDLFIKYNLQIKDQNYFTYNKQKGNNGCIGVIGGSIEYTGAPFYSAISSLKSGCDLAHVFCHKDASIPIKSYSPELIVHPSFDDDITNDNLIIKTKRWLKSMDILTYGCGLGREYPTKEIFEILVKYSLEIESNKLY
jgi:ATP-dependent NAD(P)H-hydrate dehydratase